MNRIEINSIFKLRRDNEFNYKRIEDTFIPARGEVCLVDTPRNGLRSKIGDGISTFANLPYTDENTARNIIVRGYFSNDQFYSDAALTLPIEASVNKIYLDTTKNVMYSYDGIGYVAITQTISAASSQTAGIMKLYNTLGENIDGTMTQKAISDELDDKVEIDSNVVNETLTFII